MATGMKTIFLSSVQKELQRERRAVKDFVSNDALLGRFFEVFLFEDLPARDRRADEVYLEEVGRCDVYVAVLGQEYGYEDSDGLSPTEREFDRATAEGKPRLVFVKGTDDKARHPKMLKLINKAGSQLIRKRFGDIPELTTALYSSLVDYFEVCGIIQARHVEDRPCQDAALGDVDPRAVENFVRLARIERQFPLPAETSVADVLAHLHLLCGDQPTNAAVLLFGKDSQRFFPAAEVRCMHFHGTEIERPVPFYRIFKGTLFEQVDMAADFAISKLDRSVGTRSESTRAPIRYEIPPDVIREAIVNAIAHRDYASAGAVQVSVFADRVEVWNPGTLVPPLTPESLRLPHGSVARNPRICEAFFLARYIEKFGTGTLMMIRESLAHSLPEPDFIQRGGEFTSTVWRDWLTTEVIAALNLNDRQVSGLKVLKTEQRITTKQYQEIVGCARRTAARDLDDMLDKGIIERQGSGRSAYYTRSPNRAISLPIVPSPAPSAPTENDAANRATIVPNLPSKGNAGSKHAGSGSRDAKKRT